MTANQVHLVRERNHVFIDNERVEIYSTFNPESSKDPLFFLHGWGLSPRSYQEVCDSLALNGHNIVAPALPGFGKSQPIHDTFHKAYMRVMNRLASSLQEVDIPAPSILVGHSLGAGLSLSIAAAYPHLVSELVLVCPIGGTGANVIEWAKLVASLRSEIGINSIPRMKDALPSFIFNPLAVASVGIAARHADLSEPLRNVVSSGIPVTIIAASNDEVVPIGRLQEIPEINIITIEGTHGWILSNPQECANTITEVIAAKRVR